jgi:hypothetical protein
MTDNIMDNIARNCRETNERVMGIVNGVDELQLQWRPNDTTPSIAFHVWHLGRWGDYLQEALHGENGQIWEAEDLASKWGFREANLGYADTGMGMDDNVSMALPFPDKSTLVDYTLRALAEADRAVGALRDDQFHIVVQDRYGTEWKEFSVGEAAMSYLVHANRHLGMMECLLGVQGFHGTADR